MELNLSTVPGLVLSISSVPFGFSNKKLVLSRTVTHPALAQNHITFESVQFIHTSTSATS
jgi:hypothetical protein